jgi:tRNA A-37 threonylcarbamoyl transferase component Bud32
MSTKYRHKKEHVLKSEHFTHGWCYMLLQRLNQKKETSIKIRIPRIFSYNETTEQMVMQRVAGESLSHIYGEDFSDIPLNLQKLVREFITILNNNLIEYIDITGYNFMMDKNENLWIVDFGHARCKYKNEKINPFLKKFINGENNWNPVFK